jgi:hypothetical protein
MTVGLGIAGSQDLSLKQRTDFDLVGTSQSVVIRETPGVMRMTCWSGSSAAGCILIRIIATLSDMSDRMSIAIISLYVGWLEDDYGYGYIYHDDYCITLLVTLTSINILLVYACYSL